MFRTKVGLATAPALVPALHTGGGGTDPESDPGVPDPPAPPPAAEPLEPPAPTLLEPPMAEDPPAPPFSAPEDPPFDRAPASAEVPRSIESAHPAMRTARSVTLVRMGFSDSPCSPNNAAVGDVDGATDHTAS